MASQVVLVVKNLPADEGGVRDTGSYQQLVMKSCLTLVTLWTAASQAPLSMGFSSKNTGVDCHFLLQEIVPTQESNLGLLHCRQILYQQL